MWPFFLISSMVLGLLNQLPIFSQLYFIELLGLLTGLMLLEQWHFTYPRLLTGFDMLVFFTNLNLMEFLKDPFLVLHFSYYTLMTFLTMLSVILLSMLMILLSFLSVIRHLICGNNLNCLLKLNLIYETLWTGVRNALLISVLGKLSQFCLTSLIKIFLLM